MNHGCGIQVAFQLNDTKKNVMKTILALLITLGFAACSQQKPLPVEAEQPQEPAPTEMTENNRTIGVIKQAVTKEGCPFTIKIKEVDYLLDPINLKEEFMVDGLRVRFDYLPLRRTNRCEEANPVEVLSMEKM